MMLIDGTQGIGGCSSCDAGQATTPSAASQADTNQFMNALGGANNTSGPQGAAASNEMQDMLAQILPMLMQLLQGITGAEQSGGPNDAEAGSGSNKPGTQGNTGTPPTTEACASGAC